MCESSTEEALLKALLPRPMEVVQILGTKGSEHPARRQIKQDPCAHIQSFSTLNTTKSVDYVFQWRVETFDHSS